MEVELTGVNRKQMYICFVLYVLLGVVLLLSLYPLQADIYISFYVPSVLGVFPADLVIEKEGVLKKYFIILQVSEKLKFDMKSTNIERFIRRNNLHRLKE